MNDDEKKKIKKQIAEVKKQLEEKKTKIAEAEKRFEKMQKQTAEAENKNIEDFKKIFSDLKIKYVIEEIIWLFISVIAVTAFLLFLFCFDIPIESTDIRYYYYFRYAFSSAIVFLIIRQYVIAKTLRIETVNRIAVADMFVQFRGDEELNQFLPEIVKAIIYPARKNKKKQTISIDTELVTTFKNILGDQNK